MNGLFDFGVLGRIRLDGVLPFYNGSCGLSKMYIQHLRGDLTSIWFSLSNDAPLSISDPSMGNTIRKQQYTLNYQPKSRQKIR